MMRSVAMLSWNNPQEAQSQVIAVGTESRNEIVPKRSVRHFASGLNCPDVGCEMVMFLCCLFVLAGFFYNTGRRLRRLSRTNIRKQAP